jgi:hypothetical protein
VKLTPLSTFFVNFANKICHMHCTWIYNNEFFYYKVVIYNARDRFLLAKSTKYVLRGTNFTNLKISNSYITKSKSHRATNPNHRSDYVGISLMCGEQEEPPNKLYFSVVLFCRYFVILKFS